MKKLISKSAVQEHPAIAERTVTQQMATSDYEYRETQELVQFVHEAAEMIREKGELAFGDFRIPASHWRNNDSYIFVLDKEGNMLVHPDPAMEGTNGLDLKDVHGKYIIRGFLGAVTTFPDKTEGWYHYQWTVPGGMFPRWKSSYVQLVKAPSGKFYIVGSGMYNDHMERVFVVDAVKNAVREIEKLGRDAFPLFRDPTGPYIAKDAYIFIMDLNGIELLNPAFPSLEGLDLLDMKDSTGKYVNRELINIVKTTGSGWCDYMWPKPGESLPALKSAYVSKAKLGDKAVLVGCGVYLSDIVRAGARRAEIQKISWKNVREEKLSGSLIRQAIFGEKATLGRFKAKPGGAALRHSHVNEEFVFVLSGALQYIFDDREVDVKAGDALVVPSGVPHATVTTEAAEFITFFAPGREDWRRGDDQYLRRQEEMIV